MQPSQEDPETAAYTEKEKNELSISQGKYPHGGLCIQWIFGPGR